MPPKYLPVVCSKCGAKILFMGDNMMVTDKGKEYFYCDKCSKYMRGC